MNNLLSILFLGVLPAFGLLEDVLVRSSKLSAETDESRFRNGKTIALK